MIKVAVFASGSGSNAENIVNYFHGNSNVTIDVIVSNKSDAYVHQRANALGIESFTFSKQDFQASTPVINFLKERQIDFIVLAGFLLKVPESLVNAFPFKIVNIHPALLPKYGGKGMYGSHVHEAVVRAKEKESGITIHYVNENYDEGNIIFQAKCEVLPTDSADDVAQKVHQLEYEYFPKIIESTIKKVFEI